jgi:hypothetical protein
MRTHTEKLQIQGMYLQQQQQPSLLVPSKLGQANPRNVPVLHFEQQP